MYEDQFYTDEPYGGFYRLQQPDTFEGQYRHEQQGIPARCGRICTARHPTDTVPPPAPLRRQTIEERDTNRAVQDWMMRHPPRAPSGALAIRQVEPLITPELALFFVFVFMILIAVLFLRSVSEINHQLAILQALISK